jgi:tight adherence protein B
VKGAPPFFHTFREGFWKSAASAVLVAMLSAALLAFAVLVIALPRSGSLQKRMGEFVSLAPTREGEGGQQTLLTSKMFVGAERVLARKKWWAGFKDDLELAEIRMPALQIALWSAVGAVFLGWLASAIVGSPVAFLFGLIVPFAVRSAVKHKVRRKRNLFAEQLPDNLQVLSSALRAGHSLVGALSVVVDDAAEPTRSEFQRVVADERLGVPIEEALEVVARRMESRELEQVALVAALQRQTGGNSAEVLDRVVDTIRERQELRRLVKTLTAQGRMSRWIVTALPLVVMGAILTLNRSYLDPLFHTGGGRLALAISALMVLTGSYIIQRIVDIKV